MPYKSNLEAQRARAEALKIELHRERKKQQPKKERKPMTNPLRDNNTALVVGFGGTCVIITLIIFLGVLFTQDVPTLPEVSKTQAIETTKQVKLKTNAYLTCIKKYHPAQCKPSR